MKIRRYVFAITLIFCVSQIVSAADFTADWKEGQERVWAGPDFWANRLQDWQVANGRIECVEASKREAMRTLHLLTYYIEPGIGTVEMSVKAGLLKGGNSVAADGAAGFLIAAGGGIDHRSAAFVHNSYGPNGGYFAGINGEGKLFVHDLSEAKWEGRGRQRTVDKSACLIAESEGSLASLKDIVLKLSAKPTDSGYSIELTASDDASGEVVVVKAERIPSEGFSGQIALVSHPGTKRDFASFWFDEWQVSGSKVGHDASRAFGPIACTQYTLSKGVLKMTAQFTPVSESGNKDVLLQISENGDWKTLSKTQINIPSYTATFKVANFEPGEDTQYRVVYEMPSMEGSLSSYTWSGTIAKNPADQDTVTVAAFTGNHNMARGMESGIYEWTKETLWFPHEDMTANVAKQQPDLLFFSGDQVYEYGSPTHAVRNPLDKAITDYLYKWYLWCWAYRDLAKDIPCVCIPDDHDVFQGNLWGQGGRPIRGQSRGGYTMPAEFVKAVEATQTSHFPDPFDPTPIEQGIGVYYTDMNVGGVSFGIIEDRKFKTGEKSEQVILGDPTEIKLLGERQLEFLQHWAADWSNGTVMKSVLSQTIFACVHTGWGGGARLNEPHKPSVDHDSNGWPVHGRNKALREIRKGFAFHIAGDQHLGSIVHHGIDEWDDAGWSFCVPSVANYYPRSWKTLEPGKNHIEGLPDYTGQFHDGFGNKINVYAAANPGYESGVFPARLHDRSPGYGIVHFDKPERTITMECWPRYVDPTDESTGSQYEGWPRTIDMMDNYGREAEAYLPTIKVSGTKDPVVQVIGEKFAEIVYTVRIKGNEFSPKVFDADDEYTVIVSQPDEGQVEVLNDLKATSEEGSSVVELAF
ncbi:PhoD-like phosphatase [Anaerohalosphaera lusitana]|uniref:PhoD-like phosphatase n=1 Tax=Anaerohalosphaera lusitana TaxID=1936003 RepID=A0A1U9NN13_9BACT|nr:alkaline phosphatase D family protein [Anaerohalosphaera lusitana]AQT69332.1 PhoD-like phosphatase [Anaerohalosphaera lusitana]